MYIMGVNGTVRNLLREATKGELEFGCFLDNLPFAHVKQHLQLTELNDK